MTIYSLMFKVFIQPALGMFLRAEEGAAKTAAGTAANVGAGLGTAATSERSFLDPTYRREATAEHLYDPTNINELLTSAGAGIGAGEGAAQGDLERTAASTGNAAGIVKSEQQMARDRMKAGAGVSEGVAAQDVMGAKQLNQQGLAGEAGLYGENLKGQLDAMGQVSGDINAATNASKSGWLQNAEGLAKTGADIATAYKGFKSS
jgi:hypothetical protein